MPERNDATAVGDDLDRALAGLRDGPAVPPALMARVLADAAALQPRPHPAPAATAAARPPARPRWWGWPWPAALSGRLAGGLAGGLAAAAGLWLGYAQPASVIDPDGALVALLAPESVAWLELIPEDGALVLAETEPEG
jgi:hypothetical protein